MNTIEKLHAVVVHNISRIDATMDYDRVTDAIIALADVVAETETDENTWYIGENSIYLDTLIIGAYWHYTEWHRGQNSKGYEALCALGRVFTPNCAQPEPENEAYQYLGSMAG